MFRAVVLARSRKGRSEDRERRMKGVSRAGPAVQTVRDGIEFVLTVDR